MKMFRIDSDNIADVAFSALLLLAGILMLTIALTNTKWQSLEFTVKPFEFLGGLVESGENLLETFFPNPAPRLERPLSLSRLFGLVTLPTIFFLLSYWLWMKAAKTAKEKRRNNKGLPYSTFFLSFLMSFNFSAFNHAFRF